MSRHGWNPTRFVAEPMQPGIISGCSSYYQAQEGETCRSIVDGHYMTEEDFMAMNPALDGKCDGLWKCYYCCVVGPSGITVMPPTATAPSAAIPSGQDSHCQHWYQRNGESCADIVTMFGAFPLSDLVCRGTQPPMPTQSGLVPECNKLWLVSSWLSSASSCPGPYPMQLLTKPRGLVPIHAARSFQSTD